MGGEREGIFSLILYRIKCLSMMSLIPTKKGNSILARAIPFKAKKRDLFINVKKDIGTYKC